MITTSHACWMREHAHCTWARCDCTCHTTTPQEDTVTSFTPTHRITGTSGTHGFSVGTLVRERRDMMGTTEGDDVPRYDAEDGTYYWVVPRDLEPYTPAFTPTHTAVLKAYHSFAEGEPVRRLDDAPRDSQGRYVYVNHRGLRQRLYAQDAVPVTTPVTYDDLQEGATYRYVVAEVIAYRDKGRDGTPGGISLYDTTDRGNGRGRLLCNSTALPTMLAEGTLTLELVKAAPVPAFYPTVKTVLVDRDGDVWVRESEGPRGGWRIIDGENEANGYDDKAIQNYAPFTVVHTPS